MINNISKCKYILYLTSRSLKRGFSSSRTNNSEPVLTAKAVYNFCTASSYNKYK